MRNKPIRSAFEHHEDALAEGRPGRQARRLIGVALAAGAMIAALPTAAWTSPHATVGIASWYGARFQHRRTADGEIFDRRKLTAASRVLPLRSTIKVTNLKNGRSVVVRLNDRGPYHPKRILDLSERAAALLGFRHQGLAKVRIRVLKEPGHGARRMRLATTKYDRVQNWRKGGDSNPR